MLESVKIQRRQSEIRSKLSELVGRETPSEDQVREIENLDREFRSNETRYRGALIAETAERKAAGSELETRETREWSDLLKRFEVRQVANFFDEGRELAGATKEVVAELRSRGSYRGLPIPLEALETRAGETIAGATPDPKMTQSVIDRIFAQSVAARMGAQVINIGSGLIEYPVTTSAISAGWATTETGAVGSPSAYQTTDRPLAPSNTLGVQMKITRKALKQSGEALEMAVRRDMLGAIEVELDKAVFCGSGSNGQPTGVIALAGSVGITSTDVSAIASYSVFKNAARRMMDANAAAQPSDLRWLIRPLTYSILDGAVLTGTSDAEWDRLVNRFGANAFTISNNALPASAAEDGTGKGKHTIVATVLTGGVSPIFVGIWGAVDVIRDPFSDAASGGLRLTGLVTSDVTVSRAAQIEILTNVQDRA
jgi:HK97 family phage major capsid protein